jgi:hypothetical protein
MSLKPYLLSGSYAALIAIGLMRAASAETVPDDFRIKYSHSSGPVSPPYQYSAVIEFGTGGNNFASRSAFQTKSVPIQVAPDALANFAKRMQAAIQRDWWVHPKPPIEPVGGGRCVLLVTMHGKEHRLPCSFWEVDPKYKTLQEKLIADISGVVPKSVQEQLLQDTAPSPLPVQTPQPK